MNRPLEYLIPSGFIISLRIASLSHNYPPGLNALRMRKIKYSENTMEDVKRREKREGA
jgi:hypothetical protein